MLSLLPLITVPIYGTEGDILYRKAAVIIIAAAFCK